VNNFERLINDRASIKKRKNHEVGEATRRMDELEYAIKDLLRDFSGREIQIVSDYEHPTRSNLLGDFTSLQIQLNFDWLVPKKIVIEPSDSVYAGDMPFVMRRSNVADEESEFEFLITPVKGQGVQSWSLLKIAGRQRDFDLILSSEPTAFSATSFTNALYELLTMGE
jgi:hypothetical protein